MSHQDNDEPLTDINVEIDASGLDAPTKAARGEDATLPGPRGRHGLPSGPNEIPTREIPISKPAPEEEERTTLNVESRFRKVFAPVSNPVSEPPLEETKPRQASVPLLPKSERVFSMDLPPTVPADFPPPTARGPRGPKGTVKILSNEQGHAVVALATSTQPVTAVAPGAPLPPAAVSPAPASPMPTTPRAKALQHMELLVQAPPVQARPPVRRGVRWGRAIALALLAAVLVLGLVKRDAVLWVVRMATSHSPR